VVLVASAGAAVSVGAAGAVVLVAAAGAVVAVGAAGSAPHDASSIVEMTTIASNVKRFRFIASSFGSCPFALITSSKFQVPTSKLPNSNLELGTLNLELPEVERAVPDYHPLCVPDAVVPQLAKWDIAAAELVAGCDWYTGIVAGSELLPKTTKPLCYGSEEDLRNMAQIRVAGDCDLI
jgi:hypothetical protein